MGGGKPLRETSSERKGEATAPAMASERATTLLALVLMARIISKIFRAVLWVPVALALADCKDAWQPLVSKTGEAHYPEECDGVVVA